MPINQEYIAKSIPHDHQTTFLKKAIHFDLGNFLNQREYLGRWVLERSIKSMKECEYVSSILTDYMRECVISAHDRGVFVVCSRVLAQPSLKVGSVEELICELKAREFEYFDAHKWYQLDAFDYELNNKRLSKESIRQISPFILRHVRAAFTIGIKQAAERILDPIVRPF